MEAVFGDDLPEVLSMDPNTIVANKVMLVEEGWYVEDTVLVLNGEVIPDARWRKAEFEVEGARIGWETRIAVRKGDWIDIFLGEAEFEGCKPRENATDSIEEWFGVNPETKPFLPVSTENFTELTSLRELRERGIGKAYSPRTKAVVNLVNNNIHIKHMLVDPNKWEGEWQNE